MQYANFIDVSVPVFLCLFGLLGLLAVVSPQWFGQVATGCSRWIDSDKILAVFDKRIDVDTYFLRHSRILGALVIVSVCVLAWVHVNA